MAVLRRWILVLTMLLAAGPRVALASDADRAYNAAAEAFNDTFYDQAEAGFADFSKKFPNSPRLSEAILLQAEARLQLSNYAGAITLLSARQKDAGTNADQYAFWLAEAYSRKGDYRGAADGFAKVVKDFPASPHRLEADIGEASARAALARTDPSEWPHVIAALQQTNGVFQSGARTNSGTDLVVRGYLLLSEAQLAMKDYRAAEATLQPLAQRLLSPRLALRWQYLLCRIQAADGRTNAALQSTTNLLAAAAKAGQTNFLAEGIAFQASLLEGWGRTNEAIAAYRGNLADGMPDDRRREALLKITAFYLAQDELPQAMQTLEKFLSQYPDAPASDLALLTLGELRLRRYESRLGTDEVGNASAGPTAATNDLQLALACFDTLVKQPQQSPLFGKAQLDLGWCYWRAGRMAESQAAFQAAVEHLPVSKDLATAYLRLGDTQLRQTNYTGAIQSYQAIISKFADLPGVRTNLLERALFQTARAGVATKDLATATNALQKLRAGYSNSLDTARAVLLTGQEIGRQGDPEGARRMLLDFAQTAPDSPLQPELQLAVAATYEQQNQPLKAIEQYTRWLTVFTNSSPARPKAEYDLAQATFHAHQETNALALFTSFIDHYPTNEFAPLARMWVAVYYFNAGEFLEAERNYKLIFQSTSWPPSELTYRAQMMAGRSAAAHQGWKDAKDYLTGLYNNTNCPLLDLRIEALFEYGQILMLMPPVETNKLANCEEATRVFGRICDEYPTNRLAVRAWEAKGDCYLQWALAKQQYDSLTNALDAYQRVIDSPQSTVAERSEARVGRAVVLSKWAEQKSGEEQTALLKQALSNCLEVVYGRVLRRDDEVLDPAWTQRAGEKAFDFAESLQAWQQATAIYTRLTNSVWPQMSAPLQKRAMNAFEKLAQEKSSR